MEYDVLEKSRSYMQEGQFEKAQVLIRRILHDNPNSARALELSGDLAQKTGRKKEAMEFYRQAVERYTGNDRQLQAIICLEKITKLESTNSDRFVNLAHLYKQYGLPNQGIQKIIELCAWAIENKDETTFLTGLRKIVELQPLNLRLGLSYARILRAMGRTDQAEEELKRLKEVATEQNEQAILDEINKLLPQADGGEEELDPKSRIELGNLLYEIGSKDEAVVEFNKAVSDLIDQGDVGEAINVLNRIVEIDPTNEVAQSTLQELQGGAAPAATEKKETVEEVDKTEEVTAAEPAVEAPGEAVGAEATEPAEQVSEAAEVGTDIFDDLIREVETYVDSAQGKGAARTPVTEAEEPQTLEGQIADIEFLLKEMETPPAPSFEFATEFDEFRGNIVWEEENINKRLELARRAYEAELYDTALTHARELKINKNTWPLSLEIAGASLIKLGRYSDAIKTVGPAILLEDIPQAEKVELRYLLASAYEGLGDFENALREIEHIMSTNPDYRDVKEMYELLGGKTVTPTLERDQEAMPIVQEERAAEKIEIGEPYEPAEAQEKEPRTEEPIQEPAEEMEPEKMPEDEGENISFL